MVLTKTRKEKDVKLGVDGDAKIKDNFGDGVTKLSLQVKVWAGIMRYNFKLYRVQIFSY